VNCSAAESYGFVTWSSRHLVPSSAELRTSTPAEEGTKCRELHVTNPYDSAALQFTRPLYLFIGDSDVATPAWQGAYHFEHHAATATRIVTRGGGHNSLEFNQVACAPALLASIAAGGGDLDAVAAGCPMQTTIDRK